MNHGTLAIHNGEDMEDIGVAMDKVVRGLAAWSDGEGRRIRL